MVWHPSENEISSVQQLNADDRYAYLLKKVADQETIWSLWSNGWALASNDSGREAVPIWPHPTYAAACAKDEWQGYEPKQIELDAWMERWLPGIKRDGRLVAVFPSPNDKGVVVEADFLAQNLEAELEKY